MTAPAPAAPGAAQAVAHFIGQMRVVVDLDAPPELINGLMVEVWFANQKDKHVAKLVFFNDVVSRPSEESTNPSHQNYVNVDVKWKTRTQVRRFNDTLFFPETGQTVCVDLYTIEVAKDGFVHTRRKASVTLRATGGAGVLVPGYELPSNYMHEDVKWNFEKPYVGQIKGGLEVPEGALHHLGYVCLDSNVPQLEQP